MLPMPVLVALACLAAFTVLTRETALGRRIYAVGSNAHAARLAGLPALRLKVLAFTLTGLLTGVATLISAPQLEVIEAGFGRQFELFVVTAVVVGGASMSGGAGSIAGSALGVLLLSLVRTALIFLQLGIGATYWERAIQGGFILAAVLADHVSRRRRVQR
jgi:ribose/xylose/arabinose/galactoside ABC-type transport system permease subunit